MDLQPLFHVAFARDLASIAEHGLRPSGGGHGGWGGGYGAYSRGYVHLTTWEGVGFWYSKYENIAESQSDNVFEDEMVPVVLRVDPVGLLLEVDVEGSRDAPGIDSALRTLQAIGPERLELWDGSDWVPIDYTDDLDISNALDAELEYDEDLDDEVTLYWFVQDYDNPLIPQSEDDFFADPVEME